MERRESGASTDGEKDGSLANPRKFNNQDYYSLREQCIHNNFQDLTFPADSSSIGLLDLENVKWMRPYEIDSNPQFYSNGVSRFDLCQGGLGNCWFLAALGALTMNTDMFSQVVPSNQYCQQKYHGIFHFRFWHFGDWVDVVVDDRLPTDGKGELIFVRSSDANEFWGALVEKAYAKLQGSYADLHMGRISEALVDFTGGILIEVELQSPPANLWQWMQKAQKQRLFMACSTPSEKSERITPNGLTQTHAYSITGIEEVLYRNEKEQLVRVRNPWGNKTEWNGSWSDKSNEWNSVNPQVKKKLLLDRSDGEFWMSLEDFKTNFRSLVFCSSNPDFMTPQTHLQWHYACHRNKWVKGVTAGGSVGCKDTFRLNPRYQLTLKEEDVDPKTKTSTIIVFLMQKRKCQHRKQFRQHGITCFIFKVPPALQVQGIKLGTDFFSASALVNGNFSPMEAREVCEFFNLGPGTYVLVPCTDSPNKEAEYILRTFYQRKGSPRNMNLNSNPEKAISQRLHSNTISRSQSWSANDPIPMSPVAYEARFKWPEQRYYSFEDHPESIYPSFIKNPEIDADYLQRMLNEVFLEGYKTHEGFSLDSARFIQLYMDANYSEPKVERLWRKLNHYKELFCHYDPESSGFLPAIQLCDALQAANYPMTKALSQLVSRRYGDAQGKVDLVSFTCCLLRMDCTMKRFIKLRKHTPGFPLSAEQWMMMSTYF